MADANAEPSMEDILSSIKRIIAEDSEAALSSPRVKRSVGLSPMGRPDRAPVPAADTDGDTENGAEDEVLELTDPVAVERELPPATVSEPAPPKPVTGTKQMAKLPEAEPTLVSETTAEVSRSSLAALSALVVKPETAGSDTLEGLVRELLKPMLAEWLDAKLPEIVERQVAQEIARISARG